MSDGEDEDLLVDSYLVEKGLDFDVLLSQRGRSEVSIRDMNEDKLRQKDAAMEKEWAKLLRTKSIKVHSGDAAQNIRQTVDKQQILESRFVDTRREVPETPGAQEIKSRWCIKGFRDPAILELQCQSPTLSADALSIVLQIVASKKWRLNVADIEGAFLQGRDMNRPQGKVYATFPKEGVPGVAPGSLVEICKYVYGLADAPRQWWLCLSAELEKIGVA